jgi:hypothetical protein
MGGDSEGQLRVEELLMVDLDDDEEECPLQPLRGGFDTRIEKKRMGAGN